LKFDGEISNNFLFKYLFVPVDDLLKTPFKKKTGFEARSPRLRSIFASNFVPDKFNLSNLSHLIFLNGSPLFTYKMRISLPVPHKAVLSVSHW
jgi:hypothetical protein